MRLRFTYRAATDLQRLRAFIANDNPLAARRKIDTLRRSIRLLLDQTHLGREIDEASGMRQWIADDYVVRYFVDDQVLTVNRIWHGKEDRPAP
ncbi:MAG: plasmid stabilization system protein [Hydrocarboniphaga sp.]|uniref:type II toxin-antitoxin system RelE/ParE family toxin n=1 Tax=Hydrocarboniphaga sp. TaxID=2033016 RepID=UPI0026235CC5|nr:type II toxin-antitoxin system RelE/ParE family toxin [Hydrocarboniphaga sp.]MDB5971729.1 plasmid stabilization system protein [Hydrocarboniphaga sp.]